MTSQNLYVSRKAAEDFLSAFAQALEQPQTQPVMFHVYGMGGVGKTTLLRSLKQTYGQQVDLAEVSFGLSVGIETPIKLMAEFHRQLPKPSLYFFKGFTTGDRDYENY